MPSLTIWLTMPRINAVMKIIAHTPTVIATSMISVRRWLRQRLRHARRISIATAFIRQPSSLPPAAAGSAAMPGTTPPAA